MVFEAYRRVKANKGAAGVDGQSVGQFEQDLKGNLYKLWNRMSSGCYFPPPVRMVEIPKRPRRTYLHLLHSTASSGYYMHASFSAPDPSCATWGSQ